MMLPSREYGNDDAPSAPEPLLLVIIGVSGAGKTTLGKLLAEKLACPFYDADNFHSPENIRKMAAGTPLTDADREPWLEVLHALLSLQEAEGQDVVLACSALKESYRRKLSQGLSGVEFVFLRVSPDQVRERWGRRPDHFMPLGLLESQFADLEEPQDAIVIAAEGTPSAAVVEVLRRLGREGK